MVSERIHDFDDVFFLDKYNCIKNTYTTELKSALVLPYLAWLSELDSTLTSYGKEAKRIPRHPETRKGVVSNEMLERVENNRRSGDSRIGQPFELLLNSWADKRHPGELKHLSSRRKRKQKRFP
ncbi:hypothetical protein GQ457_13G001690 [Hibiscus cannabinus]